MSVISRIISHVRLATNETTADNKYTDSTIITFIEQCWPTIVSEYNRIAKNPIIVRHQITFSNTTDEYIVPPHVGEILWLVSVDDDTGLIDWELRPRSLWNPGGPRINFEGNIIKLMPKHSTENTMELWYVPNGEISLATGAIASWDADNVQLTITASATTGVLSTRTNGYAGSMISLVDGNDGGHTEERVVTASSINSSGNTILTVSPTFADFTPASTDVYELYPLVMGKRLELVVALSVTMHILSYENERGKLNMVRERYKDTMRSIRLDAGRYENRVGTLAQRDTIDNPRYTPLWSWF